MPQALECLTKEPSLRTEREEKKVNSKKILMVATLQCHIAQFHKPIIKWLHENGHQVDVAAKNNLDTKPGLHLDIPGNVYNIPFSRSPFGLENIKAYCMLKKIINTGEYDVIHCNTPVGGILTRIAANKRRKEGKTRVIYEAHGFHFFAGGPRWNWFLWYPLEKWFSRFTSVLITINKMDYSLACRKFHTKKIIHIPGVGLNLSQFENAEKKLDLRSEFHLPVDSRIVFSVGELNRNKNHQAIIRAIACLNDPMVHYFIVGNGPLEDELKYLAQKLGVESNIHFLGYRRDVPSLLKNADVYALPSLREGLGMSSIEAMSSGLPIVTSNRHGINDYSENGVTGFKYDPMNYKGFAEGIRSILSDDQLRQKMSNHNIEVSRQFTVEKSMERLCEIYREILKDEQ